MMAVPGRSASHQQPKVNSDFGIDRSKLQGSIEQSHRTHAFCLAKKTTYATYDQFGSPSLLLVVLGNEVAFHFTKASLEIHGPESMRDSVAKYMAGKTWLQKSAEMAGGLHS